MAYNMENDTIAAISTAVSSAGIGIIRISGADAVTVADRVYRSKGGRVHLKDQASHTIHYGYIEDDDEVVDEVLVMLMRGPKSFTAEDTGTTYQKTNSYDPDKHFQSIKVSLKSRWSCLTIDDV